jgi:hypothetical protein
MVMETPTSQKIGGRTMSVMGNSDSTDGQTASDDRRVWEA